MTDECRKAFEKWYADNLRGKRTLGWFVWEAAWNARQPFDVEACVREMEGHKFPPAVASEQAMREQSKSARTQERFVELPEKLCRMLTQKGAGQ